MMAQRISNEVLAGLLFVAIVISLIGAFGMWSGGFEAITGQAFSYDEATATLTIVSVTAINWTSDALDWGSGSVTAPGPAALDSNDSVSCSGQVPGGTWTRECDDLVLENIGSDNVNITISSDYDAATLTGGTNPGFEWFFWELTSDACFGTLDPTTWTAISAGVNTTICSGFNFTSSNDQISMDVNITIPGDHTETGARTVTFVATGTTLT